MSRYPEPLHGCARVGNIQGLKHQHYTRIQNPSSKYSKHVKYVCYIFLVKLVHCERSAQAFFCSSFGVL